MWSFLKYITTKKQPAERVLLSLVCFWCVLLSESILASENSIDLPVVNIGCTIPTQSPAFTELESLYKEPFRRLGYQVNMQYLPARRTQAMLSERALEGSCGRTENFTEQMKMPTLSRIPTIVGVTSIREYSLERVDLSRVDQKRVGYIRGSLSTFKFLSRAESKLVQVSNAKSSQLMLLHDRIDVFVTSEAIMASSFYQVEGVTDLVSRQLSVEYFYPFLTDFFSAEQKILFNTYLVEAIAARGGPIAADDVFSQELLAQLRRERK
jgi:hypothetical protein